MRSQNPPQEHIERAKHIEQYLRRPVVGSVYAAMGILYAVLVLAIFAKLVHGSLLKESSMTIAIFAVIALVPAGAAFVGFLVSPNDPISRWLKRVADNWRRPLNTPPELYTFRELMVNGETSCIKISFSLPVANHTAEVKERIYNYTHGVLGKECASRVQPPSRLEIQNLIEAPMEILASECDIPILFWDVQEIYEMQDAFALTQDPLSPQYWAGMGA